MKFLQTYRTSCPIGQSGSDGFQFYSFSEGITEDELNEISLLGSYKTPSDSKQLPVAFKYFRLRSGRVGVLQSVARAEEYTGRPGNYFTHALILEHGEFSFWPIWMYKCEYFKHDLTDEEKNIQSIPPLLPVLEIDLSNLEASFANRNDFSARDFAGKENNKELLSKLLDIILFEKIKQRKGIILADGHPEEVILALSHILPFKKIQELTFSTYSQNPDKQNLILSSCRSEGCAVNFDDTFLRLDYYLFNRDSGLYAELKDQSEFSKILVGMLVSEPQRIHELYAFMDSFNEVQDADSMDLIAYIFSEKGFTAKWKQILPFVAKQAKPTYIATFLFGYKTQILTLADTLRDEDDIYTLLENLSLLIHRSPDLSEWMNIVFSIYLSFMVKRLDSYTKSLFDFNKRILSIFKGNELKNFGKLMLSEETYLSLSQSAHSELACINIFAVIVWINKTFAVNTGKAVGLSINDEMKEIVGKIDESKIPSDSFQVIITEFRDEIGTLLPVVCKAGNSLFAQRFIRELSGEKFAEYLHELILKRELEHPSITDEIRNEVIDQLEIKALAKIPDAKELKVYDLIKEWVTLKHPAISLIQQKNEMPLMEIVIKLNDAKKMLVFLDWKSDLIFPKLKESGDWENFYVLSKYIPLDELNQSVQNYFKHVNNHEPVIALMGFAQKRKDLDKILRNILVLMKRSTYQALKREMERREDGIHDYFIKLNKGIQIKRLFNLKF